MDNSETAKIIYVFLLLYCAWDSHLTAAVKTCSTNDTVNNNHTWFENMVPAIYNRREPPMLKGCPAEVKVEINLWSIGEISIEHMYFEVNLYVVLFWVDYRLNIPKNLRSTIMLPDKVASKVWTPQVAFRNCMACRVLSFDPKVDKLRLSGNELWFYLRRNPKIFCNFDISRYPMDSHSCSIDVETFCDWIDTLILVDRCRFHTFMRNSTVPQFLVDNHTSGLCSTPDLSGIYSSCIEYRITFIRQIYYHLMLTYVPSFLIVVLSWISFWLDLELAAPRVALGLTSLLTLTTQFANAQKNLPPVSYLKAIDIWMVTCMFMVFASLVEFAIGYSFGQPSNVIQVVKRFPFGQKVEKNCKPTMKTNKIDRIARIIFPVAFFSFNICYWTYYTTR